MQYYTLRSEKLISLFFILYVISVDITIRTEQSTIPHTNPEINKILYLLKEIATILKAIAMAH